jgi:hypothetical protein
MASLLHAIKKIGFGEGIQCAIVLNYFFQAIICLFVCKAFVNSLISS